MNSQEMAANEVAKVKRLAEISEELNKEVAASADATNAGKQTTEEHGERVEAAHAKAAADRHALEG